MQHTQTEPVTAAATGPRGLAPTVTLLVVSLVVAGIGVYELCGFGLHSLARRPHLFSDGLATAGVIVAAVAAGAAFGNLAWTLTASRQALPDTPRTDPAPAAGTPEDPYGP
ncbi:hypothetical protein KUM39_11545 [Streptomyces sp. J2-1]|uniref:hypothetical protein n=1 Tax=Streptomyces corallincola TaxID=2851888 RepID=UPI001C3938EE|nr:hypothetical protein [Streptomyces corallincola]MBV2354991.1 hypothetical protein [Streptomyces corallincola]